jgi:hypothetical protein
MATLGWMVVVAAVLKLIHGLPHWRLKMAKATAAIAKIKARSRYDLELIGVKRAAARRRRRRWWSRWLPW